jgi:ParB family chromosome partitioning protein
MITTAPHTRGATKSELVHLDQVDFSDNARPTNADKVAGLVRSIRLLGLQSAPTVIERDGRYKLVSGRHRVEAMRVIGRDPIPVRVADFDDVEAQLWRISENLHRNELSALERAEQVTEFARLSQEKADAAKAETQAAQVAHPDRSAGKVEADAKRYEQRGDSLASRDLGLSRDEVRRARAIAALPDVVKAKAADLGLDRNQSALLDAAKAPTPQAQVETLERRAERAAERAAEVARPLRNLEYLAAGELAR